MAVEKTNIFFGGAASKTDHGGNFLWHEIVPEGWMELV